jgi:hypothetical protein
MDCLFQIICDVLVLILQCVRVRFNLKQQRKIHFKLTLNFLIFSSVKLLRGHWEITASLK